MDKQAAKNLITQTFEVPFDEQRFKRFARNLLNQIDESKDFAYQGRYIPDAFKGHVRQYKRLGTYTDPEGETVDILIVRLKKETALSRARTMQRNFVARYLKGRDEKDAAIVAYYTDGQPDWRFSLVKMEYQIQQSQETGRLKVSESLTPARRYSFLVGENEPNHTAQQQLLPILQETRRNPTLAQLEAAFNIESVTKEFFERYKALFLDLRDDLDGLARNNKAVEAEFKRADIDTANFAKKLLGQIVFLYFLQKKGWLGVAQGQPWGSGPKDFLRRLFEKASLGPGPDEQIGYADFFNDVLEPLFYEALAIERPDNFYPRLNCRIPFLNGGLFEPVGDYHWREVDILLSNDRFRDIFDTFDLFNFTVREDEPLEKEVAVDPEMLGKVFENLLEVQDRKSKGAFYTPREIVHYMCQESLINYLDTRLNTRTEPLVPSKAKQQKLFGKPDPEQLSLTATETRPMIPRGDIDTFIRKGEFGLEHDAAKANGTKSYTYHLPQSIRDNAAAIDAALADIKICDPAIGSGAFPVGLMHEIVKARTVLTTYLQPGLETARTPYHLKRHAIQESIYGVDIDPGAVEIAKLRLWLSLVVDEDDYQKIQPLPNLDYKIVCGNALLGVEKDLLNYHLFEKIEQLKPRYFKATDPDEKRDLKTRIDSLIAQLTHGNTRFDFDVYFSEVFHKKGGFDIVIGNPPYVRHERIKEQKPALEKAHPDVYQGMADLYVYFYGQGMKILHRSGFLAFITSNKFMRAGYGKKLRQFLAIDTTPHILIDFRDLPVFDATAYPCIVITQKAPALTDNTVTALTVGTVPQIRQITQVMAQKAWPMPQKKALTADGWRLEPPKVLDLLDKLRRAGTPLGDYVRGRFYRGILTGYNQAFVIDRATRDRLIAEDPASVEVLKPFLRGRDVKRWCIDPQDSWLIFTRRGINIDEYPAIKRYLSPFKERLTPKPRNWKGEWLGRKAGSYQWYEIQDNIAYWQEFEVPKIAYPDIARRAEFAFDNDAHYLVNTLYLMPTNKKWLLGILNSKTAFWFYTKISTQIRGGFVRFIAQYVSRIPIPQPPKPNLIESLVARILKAKKANPAADVSALEAEIDQLVHQLYGLTPEEIAIVEGETKDE